MARRTERPNHAWLVVFIDETVTKDNFGAGQEDSAPKPAFQYFLICPIIISLIR